MAAEGLGCNGHAAGEAGGLEGAEGSGALSGPWRGLGSTPASSCAGCFLPLRVDHLNCHPLDKFCSNLVAQIQPQAQLMSIFGATASGKV